MTLMSRNGLFVADMTIKGKTGAEIQEAGANK